MIPDKCLEHTTPIRLDVFKINTVAKEFYKKHDFSIVEETENSYIMESDP